VACRDIRWRRRLGREQTPETSS